MSSSPEPFVKDATIVYFDANGSAIKGGIVRESVQGKADVGRVLVFKIDSMLNLKYIINFPTKRHWKGKSKMEDIDSGLVDLIA